MCEKKITDPVNSEYRNDLIKKHRGLVRKIARSITHITEIQDDAFQAGMVGLLEAIQNYDPERGVSFESFAKKHIRGKVIRVYYEYRKGGLTGVDIKKHPIIFKPVED